jgi:hypothetical protein
VFHKQCLSTSAKDFLVRSRTLAVAALFIPVALGGFLVGHSAKVRASIDLFNQVFQLVEQTAVDSLPEDELYTLAAKSAWSTWRSCRSPA